MKPTVTDLVLLSFASVIEEKGVYFPFPFVCLFVCLFDDASLTAQQVDPVGTGISRVVPGL
jgi:hypothetical protein